MEFDIKVRVYEYANEVRNPNFSLTDELAIQLREHLESSILGSPFIVPDENKVFVYDIDNRAFSKAVA